MTVEEHLAPGLSAYFKMSEDTDFSDSEIREYIRSTGEQVGEISPDDERFNEYLEVYKVDDIYVMMPETLDTVDDMSLVDFPFVQARKVEIKVTHWELI